jgi:hypothetical protein
MPKTKIWKDLNPEEKERVASQNRLILYPPQAIDHHPEDLLASILLRRAPQ